MMLAADGSNSLQLVDPRVGASNLLDWPEYDGGFYVHVSIYSACTSSASVCAFHPTGITTRIKADGASVRTMLALLMIATACMDVIQDLEPSLRACLSCIAHPEHASVMHVGGPDPGKLPAGDRCRWHG